MKAVRNIVGLVVVAVLFVVGFRTMQTRTEVMAVHELYEEADSAEEFREVRRQYEALLDQARGSARDMIEAHIAGCDAWIAFYDTTSRPTVAKYRDALEKFRKAKELTGDPDAERIWAEYIRTFEGRLEESLGPRDPSVLRAEFDRLAPLPFLRSRNDLETLYRWKETWERQKAQEGQDPREREELRQTLQANAETFEKARSLLADNYAEIFLNSAAEARQVEFTPEEIRQIGPEMDEGPLDDKATVAMRPMWDLSNVRRFDPERAERFAQEYAEELAFAQRLARRMEPR